MKRCEDLIRPLGRYPIWSKLTVGMLLAAGSLVGFAKLVSEIFEQETVHADAWAYQVLHSADSPAWHSLMVGMTQLGSGSCAIILSLLVMFWLACVQREPKTLLMFVCANLGGVLLNHWLKALFHRARPLIDPAIGAVGFSLPSGHAMGAMIFYGFLGYLLIRSQSRLSVKLLMGAILAGFILLIGISRIYLQAHYASDVLAGFMAGSFWLIACIFAMDTRPWYRRHFAGQHPPASSEDKP